MKKLLLSALLGLSIAASACAVYADDGTAAGQSQQAASTEITQSATTQQAVSDPTNGSQQTVSVSVYDPGDPYQQVKAKYQQLLGLRQQESTVCTNIGTQNKVNNDIRQQLKLDAKSKNSLLIKDLQNQINSIRSQTSALREKLADLHTQLSQAIRQKNKTSAAQIKNSIKDVNSQITNENAQIKDLETQIKDAKSVDKDLWNKLSQANAQVRELQASMLDQEAAIASLRADKAKQWIAFDTAIRAKDYVTANTCMDNIMADKTQIIADLNTILGLKQQVEGILNALE